MDRPRSGVGYSGYRETRLQTARDRGWGGREAYGQSLLSDERTGRRPGSSEAAA